MPSCEHHEAEEKHRCVKQQRFLPSNGITHKSSEYCGHQVTQNPTTRYENYIIIISLERHYHNHTNPAPLFLCDVEIIKYGKGSEDDVVGGGAVLSPMTVVVLDVLGAVLQLVEDDAGAGHAGPLQEAHQVDHEGASELLDQATVALVSHLRL